MDKDTSAPIKTFLDEGIAGGEVLDDVFIVDVVHLDDVMCEIAEQVVVQGQPQGREDVADIGLLQSFCAP